jgi:multicomponent Na+:H+ antiporter subunit D
MPEALHPSLIYLLGAALVPAFRGRARQVVALLVPVLGLLNYYAIPAGATWTARLLEFDLVVLRADAFALLVLHIFTVVSFLGTLYIAGRNDPLELAGGLLYSGSAMGAVLAGDFVTLFLFWEALTLGAILCLLARRRPAAGRAAMRYLLVHLLGGVVLLAGIALHLGSGGGLAFDQMPLHGTAAWLIFLGFGVNAAWPVLGAWLPDTYPEASAGGLVFMATFTTKTAVYALARVFPGEPALVGIGCAMVLLPLVHAALESDLRRVLAYCLVNQVGFMVVGVGLGTGLALNAVAAHIYCHVLYNALLLMALGAVLDRVGAVRAERLGGLARSMPLTALFYGIGAASISVPFLCGFLSKSMFLAAAGKGHHGAVSLVLFFGAVVVFLLAGLRVPHLVFFGAAKGAQGADGAEAPLGQLLAMGATAFLCLFVGVLPGAFLLPMLPDQSALYNPYTLGHVSEQFAGLSAIALLYLLALRRGWLPDPVPGRLPDLDRLYRSGGPLFLRLADRSLNPLNAAVSRVFVGGFVGGLSRFLEAGGPRLVSLVMVPVWRILGHDAERVAAERESLFRRAKVGAFPIGLTALLAVLLLGLLTAFYYVGGR